MILQLFRRKSKANEAIKLHIYENIVLATRQKYFYAQFQVPDTPLGRYEMLSLHMFLTLHRFKSDNIENKALTALGQDLADEFFKDIDHSLREFGIGDQSVPKRMKKLARMFYGRVGSYGAALDSNDREALSIALARNIQPDLENWPQADDLCRYVFASRDHLSKLQDQDIAAGNLTFLNAEDLKSTVQIETA
ncbi:ubiquinol-cytochrome C chaperone family protein [Paenochrobactrum sp. BZR 588]|uniref:ubiquinol-cytochrome C chaperone family protein n=1 Tax=Paenochrobactrum TaxID=999488 RepID=UPI0035BC7439